MIIGQYNGGVEVDGVPGHSEKLTTKMRCSAQLAVGKGPSAQLAVGLGLYRIAFGL